MAETTGGGRVFFVSGGTSGIGLAVARQAQESGDSVFVTGNTAERLDRVLKDRGDEHLWGCVCDAADVAATELAVCTALERFGGIDVLVASAGRGGGGDLTTGAPEDWRAALLVNVLGPAVAVRACLPALIKSRGNIVLIGSVLGRRKVAGMYSVTKHAVSALAEGLRQELVGSGISVSVLQPGRVDTPWWPNGTPPPALDPASVARAVHWIIDQPDGVDVSEVVVRPAGQAL